MTNEDPSGKWLHRMEERLIGDSLAMRKLRESIRLAAQGQQPVLIVGETGTGKELVARTLRQQSCPSGRMAYLNALEFPRGFFELRLFGGEPRSYSGQAYTGAMKDAEGGLLYLDEVTHIDSAGQACLSRVLEEGEYRPLNSTKTEKVTARLVASTVCRPKEAVDRGLLLPDIYRYLSALIIEVPPVRERRGDIPPLADYLLTRASMELNRTRPEIDCETMAWLCTYTWPGNVRELRNAMEVAVVTGRVKLPSRGLVDGRNTRIEELAGIPHHRARARVLRRFHEQYLATTMADCRNDEALEAERTGLSRWALRKFREDRSAAKGSGWGDTGSTRRIVAPKAARPNVLSKNNGGVYGPQARGERG